jgi:Kef-type K+ transport system membrane component KefB
MTVYQELALLLLLAATVGALAVRLRQPLIVAFILVGMLVGPSAIGLVEAHGEIDLLAQLGITILLFVVGLKLDLHLVRNLGPVALATGLGQLAFTILFGYLIARGLGIEHVTALYVAIALTFSSTIIIVKLLSDKREIDSLHGRISMGFLIVQDIAVVIAMVMMSAYGAGGGEEALGLAALMLVLKMGAMLLVLAALMKYVLPRLLHLLANSTELLLVFAIAWGAALASLGDMAGFSKEVGAFLAGFSLASTNYREAISSRLTSLRDFLLLFFFIDLGSKLELGTLGSAIPEAMALSIFVLIGNPLIVLAIMGYMGYRKRTGFLAGLTVAQISEFSIVFAALGVSLGHISIEAVGLITLVGLVTITASTYMILYSHPLYAFFKPWLGIFERRNPFREMAFEGDRKLDKDAEVIVFGMGRFGGRFAKAMHEQGVAVLGIDFDPEVTRGAKHRRIPIIFGDAEDPVMVETLPLSATRWVVSTISDLDLNLALIKALRQHGYDGQIAVTTHTTADARKLSHAGVARIIHPFEDAADFAARTLFDDDYLERKQ